MSQKVLVESSGVGVGKVDQLTKYFGKYGEIRDSVIMKDRHTGRPRGFGFITYADPSVVDTVIAETHVINDKQVTLTKTISSIRRFRHCNLHGQIFEQVEIKRTIPKGFAESEDFKTKKIFVGGIPTSVTEDEFKNFFSKYGKVVEHEIIRDHVTKRSRGFRFVVFDNEQVVDTILANGNMIDMEGSQLPMVVEVITADIDNAWAISTYNDVSVLIKACQLGSLTTQGYVVGALKNLATVEEIRVSLGEEGAIPALVQLLVSGTAAAQEKATNCIAILVFSSEFLRALIIQERRLSIEISIVNLFVESDKADMDVETFYDGILATIIVDEGEVAPVGAPIGLLVESQDEIAKGKAATSSSHSAPSAPPPPPPPPPAPAASVAPEDCGDTVREEACEAAQD
ncbi:Heterogeneous nuclear ribonucleoprotein 1 [Camellia lanceoleosa]|uniref:Heterogeneous nuclear ribonucleoprotein 1 n=1 Tax=Camellia lanceoleosa TaxID=1840588 RepID=A0ACC0H7I7_9ERIC|nr:Heterogeneous nuclear ribonucleoprotein 1 [Camellia lanceoleosa]